VCQPGNQTSISLKNLGFVLLECADTATGLKIPVPSQLRAHFMASASSTWDPDRFHPYQRAIVDVTLSNHHMQRVKPQAISATYITDASVHTVALMGIEQVMLHACHADAELALHKLLCDAGVLKWLLCANANPVTVSLLSSSFAWNGQCVVGPKFLQADLQLIIRVCLQPSIVIACV
jgi:hypothetical protein